MKYSIIIPIYNTAKYLRKCLNSIICQQEKNYELILVDDGSNDSSERICDEYANKHDFIKVIHKLNGGSNSARKVGAFAAIGDYLLFIDADDYIDSDYLKSINNFIDINASPSLLIWGFKSVNEQGEEINHPYLQLMPCGIYTHERLKDIKKALLFDSSQGHLNYGGISFSLWSKAIKRDLYLSIIDKIDDEVTYGEDLLTTKYLLESPLCSKVAICNYTGYYYFSNTKSLINSCFSFEKMQKYENTLSALYLAFASEEEKVYSYAFNALIGLLFSIYHSTKNYADFTRVVRKTYKYSLLWKSATNFTYQCKNLKERLKIYVIKHRKVNMIYLYFALFCT